MSKFANHQYFHESHRTFSLFQDFLQLLKLLGYISETTTSICLRLML